MDLLHAQEHVVHSDAHLLARNCMTPLADYFLFALNVAVDQKYSFYNLHR